MEHEHETESSRQHCLHTRNRIQQQAVRSSSKEVSVDSAAARSLSISI